jgi:hypothetical protein
MDRRDLTDNINALLQIIERDSVSLGVGVPDFRRDLFGLGENEGGIGFELGIFQALRPQSLTNVSKRTRTKIERRFADSLIGLGINDYIQEAGECLGQFFTDFPCCLRIGAGAIA